MRDPLGAITSFVSVVKDITEHRSAKNRTSSCGWRVGPAAALPEAPPIVEGLDLAAATTPSGAMNGDYFDFVTLRDGALVIAIGDVSGTG